MRCTIEMLWRGPCPLFIPRFRSHGVPTNLPALTDNDRNITVQPIARSNERPQRLLRRSPVRSAFVSDIHRCRPSSRPILYNRRTTPPPQTRLRHPELQYDSPPTTQSHRNRRSGASQSARVFIFSPTIITRGVNATIKLDTLTEMKLPRRACGTLGIVPQRRRNTSKLITSTGIELRETIENVIFCLRPHGLV